MRRRCLLWLKPAAGVPIAVLLVIAMAGALSAAPIGVFGVTGQGFTLFQRGGAEFLDWCPSQSATPPPGRSVCGVSNTNFGFLTANGGLFPAGTNIAIDDLTNTATTSSLYTYFPTGGAVNIPNFFDIDGYPNLKFTATLFVPASCGASQSQACIGPYQFNQVGANTTVSFTFDGTLLDTTDNTTGSWKLTFLSEYQNTPLSTLLVAPGTHDGIFANNLAGTMDLLPTSVPEGQTLPMALLGLTLLIGGSVVRGRWRA